jgi:hypothetical protein
MQGSQGVLVGGAAMSTYAVFFTLKGEAIARAMEQPSDRVTVVSKAVETHELIEAEDLNPILEQAKGITAQLPGT